MKVTLQGLMALGLMVHSAGAVYAADSTRVEILSATVRDQKIAGATVILQRNGEQSVSVSTDAEGHAVLADALASDPNSLLIVRSQGFSDLVAKCPCSGMTYAISPNMDKLDGMRIVLDWGAQPRDLDGHLGFPNNHVFFFKKSGADANLDVDHTDGFGPETITIARKHPGERYVYTVHDYTDKERPASLALSGSDAKVFVYVGQTLIRTYYVPKDQRGNIWKVFAISAEGEILDINVMSGSSVGDSTTDQFAADVFGPSFATSGEAGNARVAARVSPPIPEDARRLNTLGEASYKSNDYGSAIVHFQAAIAADDSYGQAYSNLGLVFQKSGRVAEALWANRKAIALASGPNANTVRASTHFNNGRIYEDKEQWSDALREYRAAQDAKSNTVYENAIARVQQHGAQ